MKLRYEITYVPRTVFIVHLLDRDISTFHCCGMLYVADWAELSMDNERSIYTTVCTKAEEARVKRAYELLHMSGFSSYNEAIHLVQDGSNITGLLGLTTKDVCRAYKLYGQHPAYVRGKTAKK
jgi:hypothetical protein